MLAARSPAARPPCPAYPASWSPLPAGQAGGGTQAHDSLSPARQQGGRRPAIHGAVCPAAASMGAQAEEEAVPQSLLAVGVGGAGGLLPSVASPGSPRDIALPPSAHSEHSRALLLIPSFSPGPEACKTGAQECVCPPGQSSCGGLLLLSGPVHAHLPGCQEAGSPS